MSKSLEVSSLFFILGCTASGKTDLALFLAEKFSAACLNGDSIQIYKNLNIGSAKPDFNQFPHIPHYLFDAVEAPQVWTAGDYRREALAVLNKEIPKKKFCVVGGSGFYIQALEKGMYPLKPTPPSILNSLKQKLKEKGVGFCHKELKEKDPAYAETISPQDSYRILRALAVIQNEGRLFSDIVKNFQPQKLPWSYKKIAWELPKEELQKRVKKRTENMLKHGLIEEMEALLKQGLENWKPLQSLGYKETLQFLKGDISKEELFSLIVQNTLSFAKRQKTWFRKDKDIVWYDFKTSPLTIYKELLS